MQSPKLQMTTSQSMPIQPSGKAVSVIDVISSIATRLQFGLGKDLLLSYGIPASLGWERTLARVRSQNKIKPLLEPNDLAQLQKVFEMHTLVGEKLVRLYGFAALPDTAKRNFIRAVKNAPLKINIPDSIFKDAYPLAVVDIKKLRANEGGDPVLTAVFPHKDSVVFQFCSVRSFREQVEIDINQFEKQDREKLEDYTEVIGIRAMPRQCYDSVIVHLKDDLIELRVDAPEGISVEQQRLAVKRVTETFDQLASVSFGYSPFGISPFNYHKILNNLYKKSGEGRVFRLGFTATSLKTSSNNGARLLRSARQDLRKDDFHQGGKNAVKTIEPYTIGVVWSGPQFFAEPKLIVPGSVKMLYKSPVLFPEVIVRDCMTENDFSFVASKIEKFRV